MREIGLSNGEIEEQIKSALSDASWRSMAALDAAARMTAAIVDAGGLSRRSQAARILKQFAERARREIGGEQTTIPSNYWMVSPAGMDEEGEEQLKMRGAVLVQVHGRRAKSDEQEVKQALSPELFAALEEKPSRPGRDLLRLLRQDGLLTPLALIAALALAASGLISDMAERSHSAQTLRQLPQLGARFLRLCFELALTTAGLIWFDLV